MTPAQQSALEALVGRALTADEVAAIGPNVDARRDDLIEAALNAGRTKSRAVPCHLAKKLLIKRGKWRGIVLASQNDQHAAVESAYSAVALAEDARMEADFCDESATALMQPLITSGLLSADDAAALQSMCTVPDPIPREAISRALNKVAA